MCNKERKGGDLDFEIETRNLRLISRLIGTSIDVFGLLLMDLGGGDVG